MATQTFSLQIPRGTSAQINLGDGEVLTLHKKNQNSVKGYLWKGLSLMSSGPNLALSAATCLALGLTGMGSYSLYCQQNKVPTQVPSSLELKVPLQVYEGLSKSYHYLSKQLPNFISHIASYSPAEDSVLSNIALSFSSSLPEALRSLPETLTNQASQAFEQLKPLAHYYLAPNKTYNFDFDAKTLGCLGVASLCLSLGAYVSYSMRSYFSEKSEYHLSPLSHEIFLTTGEISQESDGAGALPSESDRDNKIAEVPAEAQREPFADDVSESLQRGPDESSQKIVSARTAEIIEAGSLPGEGLVREAAVPSVLGKRLCTRMN